MKLTVEFLGPARRLAQIREVTLDVADAATYRDILRQLAELYPSLVDSVIVTSPACELSPAFLLNINGRRVVADLDASAGAGEQLIIMLMEAGG